jgi:transcriptional regulator GlxA family with amidase domain
MPPKKAPPSKQRRIVFTVYPGVSLLDLSGPLEAFRVADAFSAPRGQSGMYECVVVSSRGGAVMTADGLEINTTSMRNAAKKPIDTLVVPGGFRVEDVTRDLALALIEQDTGRKVSIEVARMLVVYLKRSGGQSQYSALLEAQAESDSNTFADLELWIAEHLTENLRVEALAERVNMSPRNFARAYSKMRGRTPAKAVEAIRVDAARRRLQGDYHQ